MRKKGLAVLLSTVVCAQLAFSPINVQAATTLYNNATGNEDGYDYELWKDNGTTSMTLNGNGTFDCSWSNINNALFRTGRKFDSTKTYQQIGNISVDYGCNYQPNGNSYLCVYGWTVDPLVEYYVVDSWGTWRPPGATAKGQITVDGGTYDVYETTRYNQPSIKGNTTFQQYWSVRTSKRTSGTISVSEHFKKWESMGMKCGKLYETALTVEGYQSAGSAKVYKNNITIGGSGSSNVQPTQQPTVAPTQSQNNGTANKSETMQCENMTLSGTYAGTINNPFNGVALYANNDKASWTQYFGANTHDFTLRGCADGNTAASVDLMIGGEKKGTFVFNNSTPTDVTIKNVKHGTGNQKIELVVTTDVGTWDAFIDYVKIGSAGSAQTQAPTVAPTKTPTAAPTQTPTQAPTATPTVAPTQAPASSGSVSMDYKTTGDWGSGFQGEIIIKNNTSSAINGWTATFTTSAKINSLWGATLVSQSGNTVTVKNADWDTTLAAGKSVSIGFVADGSASNSKPANFKFNGSAVNGGSTQPTQAPTQAPTAAPTQTPTVAPTQAPTVAPTQSSTGVVRPAQVSINKSTPYGYTSMQSNVAYGTAKHETYYSNTTRTNRGYVIYLPAGYTTAKKYPVIYMLHGIGGNEYAFGSSVSGSALMKIAGNMQAKGEAKEAIIVFPNIRVSTTPETNIFDANNYKYYDAFREELINNLMPHINKTYSTLTGRENTAVAGFSMGGRESLYIGVSKADTFAYTAAFCPAPGNLPNQMNGVYEAGLFSTSTFKLPAAYNNNSLVMIVKGQSDGVVGDQPLLYHNTLTSNGSDHVYYDMPGGHDEGVYGNGFYNFLKYVFK